MSESSEPDRPVPEPAAGDVRPGFVERRRERLRAEIRRNRAGGHLVPTWVMAVAVALMVAGWLYLIISS